MSLSIKISFEQKIAYFAKNWKKNPNQTNNNSNNNKNICNSCLDFFHCFMYLIPYPWKIVAALSDNWFLIKTREWICIQSYKQKHLVNLVVNVVLNSLEFKETNVSGQYLSIPPENNQKSDIFWYFQGV